MSYFTKKSIINISGCHLGTIFLEDNWDKDVIGIKELEKFIESDNVFTIYAIIVVIEDNKRLKFFDEVSNEYYERIVIFTKNKPCTLSEENLLDSTQVTSVCGTLTLALYHTLNNVFTPLFNKQTESSIQRQIASLQTNLRSKIILESPDVNLVKDSIDPTALTVIQSVEHEVQYWEMVATSKKDRFSRKIGASFRDILQAIAKDFRIMGALPINDAEDLLEKAHNTLDDLWRNEPSYPKDRMKHLMDLMARDIWTYVNKQLKACEIWEEEFNKVADLLLQSINFGEKWLTTCKQLTEIFWPSHSANPWKEGVYQPTDLCQFILLLKEILNIRTIHKQLIRLLTFEEQEELKTKEIFKPFKGIDMLAYGEDVNNYLLKSEKEFEYLLQPAEKRVAMKLKKQLSTVNANTRQLIYEFSRYSELINRPVLKQALQSERQYLLNSLHDYIKEIHSQTNLDNYKIHTKQETSQIIKEIILIKQMESKAKEIQKVSQKLLDDLNGYENIKHTVDELSKDLKQQHSGLFDAWSSQILAQIGNKSLSLKETDPVVRFSKEKLMTVNYSARLVTLISEVRQLLAMGYNVPAVIEDASEHAKKFMQIARILEQIANFHNTIGDQMISSQKPMMLTSALELSKLVQEQEVVSWGQEKSVEKYVETLKKAVEKLSLENNLLTSFHMQIVDKINELEEVDLIKEYNKWKGYAKSIRAIMTQVEEKRFKNMITWKTDIDKKLSLVLEKQYVKSLDTLHLNLKEIRVDLIYRNSTLEFSPNEDSLKNMYEQQLKKYLDIPKTFRGICETPENIIYSGIIERNHAAFQNVSAHKEALFQELSDVLKHWQSWLQLEALDTSKLSTWQHWDLHFRASKTFGQEIAKLPSTEERVGCFLISLSRLRSDLESHNRSYWDQLVYSLKDSIAEDVVKLQNYIDPSTAALTKQPVTLEEIGESSVVHSNILTQSGEMEITITEMLKKSQILSSWSREQVDSVNRLKGSWERLQSLIDNHQHIMEKQMDTIKTTLNIKKDNLIKEAERFEAKWEQMKSDRKSIDFSANTIEDLYSQLKEIEDRRKEWDQIKQKNEELQSEYLKFNIGKPEMPFMEDMDINLSNEENLWSIFNEFYTEFNEINSEYWIVFRKKYYLFEDFLKKWDERLKSQDNSRLQNKIVQEIHNYQETAPILKYVKGDDFSEKHWMDTFNLLKIHPKPVDQLILKDFLQVSENLKTYAKELQIICKKAASEIIVRQALTELEQWEIQTKFTLFPHKDSQSKELMLVKDFKEILNSVGDQQSLLQSLKNSADYDSFIEKASNWETRLSDLDFYLTSLSQIQRKWIYLEPIFGSGTLAKEKSRFDKIDKEFRHMLTFIQKDARVIGICRYPNIRSILVNQLEQVSRCQSSLENFLKEKRDSFPRFLFLSDDDLLEVVGQSSKEQVIQSHLKKIFAGIHSIMLDAAGQNITAMCSLYGEEVVLENPVHIGGPVEQWLNALVIEMQRSLKALLVKCQMEKQASDPLMYPSQILCLSDSVNFTTKCEQAISSMTLTPLLAKYKVQLGHYSSLDFTSDIKNEKKPFAVAEENRSVLELKLKALLLDTMHHIGVLGELINDDVSRVSDWTWQKQLRYYANSTGDITVKMGNARMEYAYEYLGNATKLVRTILTDKSFLTLTQGMHLGMGGNPYGPAGTGKTETVKALGALLGRQVLVFNCDEGIDSTSMGRLLTGLVRTGAWGCFDEFNRLDEATLSAVSMLIYPIQVSLRTNQNTVTLLDEQVPVNKHCGIFVTLNPAGGEYGGRNKLPDNLKQLFRPVVMTHPDQEQIAKTLLHCDGYQNADVIAKKIIEVFDLSSKLLSKQQHYDWGLRAIRTILAGCGTAVKNFKMRDKLNATLENELSLVVNVLRLDTSSKLTFPDSLKFDAIVQDVFKTGVNFENMENEVLMKAINNSFEELRLISNERQVNKCLEFFEQLKQRMGVVIVGPACSGKSTVRNVLRKALSKLNKAVKQYAFNPKSMPRQQLLGTNKNDVNQWNDGVITNYSLQVSSEPADVWSWLVCDGDVDPDWIESLNSVLDDNRLLSLPSGWRIQFGTNVNFIFETHDLSHASPATISRLGIVFLSEEDLSLNDFVKSYLLSQPESVKDDLEVMVNDYFIKAVSWMMNDGELTVPSSKISVAKTGLSQLTQVKNKTHFTVAVVNGLGQHLQQDFRELFAQQVYDWTGEVTPPLILKSFYNKERDIIDVYHTNPNITAENINSSISLVLTGQICMYLENLKIWLEESSEQHFLIVGPHGSAKKLMLDYLVNERSDMEQVTIHCASNLQPNCIINKLSQHCIVVNTHKGKVYKPKKGFLLFHLRNLHLLKLDKWGTNMLVEFLNQLIVYKGFFDANTEFVGIQNFIVAGTLSATDTLSTRFFSNLHVFNVGMSFLNLLLFSLPEQEDLSVITAAYLTSILKSAFPNQILPKAKIVRLSATMIAVYLMVKNSFTPAQCKHYLFSPHDITDWCNSIMYYKNSENRDIEDFIVEVVFYQGINCFGSKMISSEDEQKLNKIFADTFQSQWGKSNLLEKTSNTYFVPLTGDLSKNRKAELKKLNREDWLSLVEQGIKQYEREGQILDIIINNEILSLTATITRSLCQNKSNLVLIGKSGIGRRSSVKISSALLSSKLVTVTTNTQPQFNKDLKMAMQSAALDGETVLIQFEDNAFVNTNNINVINSLISSGEIPGLYTNAELESFVKTLQDESDQENFEGDLFQFFAEKVKRNLHVVVSLDIHNDNLRDIIASCPAFTQKSVIVWKSNWSNETIESLPRVLIEQSSEDNLLVEYTNGFSKIYDTTKSNIATPSRYISLIKLYKSIYKEKITHINSRKTKLQAGVSKLKEAEDLVNELKEKAEEQQNKLAEKQSKANAALDMITNTMKNANTQKEQMEVLKRRTEDENVQLLKRKKEIEEELSEVEPLIQEARAAVGNIKSESLTEIRSLRAPPEVIRDILEGVLRLMGMQDTSWNSMKTFLAKRGIKEEIRSFDANRIQSDNRVAVERLISTKGDSFDPKLAKRASVAAAPLAAWVAANVKYSKVLDKIRPLEKEQNKLVQNLTNAQSQLTDLSVGLSDVDATVGKLKEQLSAYTKEAAEIEIGLKDAQETLESAEGLVQKLSGENERWQEQLKELSEELKKLPSNCLLAASFISYLSGESERTRMKMLKHWCSQTGMDLIDFESLFSTEREQLQWKSEGLSSDKLSIQNAIITMKSEMVPLLIDPTSNAVQWLKQHLKQKNLESIAQSSLKFSTNLELAVRFGKTLIIEEVEEVCYSLYPILKQEFICQGERKLMNLNGKLVDLHKDFKLILSSRNEKLELPADIAPLISLMNFKVTHEGLTEQLLSATVKQEKPELETRQQQLLHKKEELQKQQYNLQNQLLDDLANYSGNILKNKNLLNSLNETKASFLAITAALKESMEVQSKLVVEYDVYREIADYGSTLYFTCNNFAKHNSLYLISISAYTKLFLKALQTFQTIDNKLYSQKKHLYVTVYNYMSRGIFKQDRLIFLFHLIHVLYSNHITESEWNFLLGNTVTKSDVNESEIPPWVPKQSIITVQNLQACLPELYKKLLLNDFNIWKKFMNSDTCENQLPSECNLTEFQKVLVVHVLRPDRLYSSMMQCVLQITGLKSIEPPVLDLSQFYKETDKKETILILTTPGTDPTNEIRDLAETVMGPNQYFEVAMGEGQESKAIQALHKCAENGVWLILKNVHLVTYWLPVLCQNFKNIEAKQNFRLWLISEPVQTFNFVLAQNSLKIVYEAPQGLKNNILRTYSIFGDKYVEKLNSTAARIFFVFSCLHALLEERRNFIPQGWSKFYEFNTTDLVTCLKLTEDMWQHQNTHIPWKFISGISNDAVYGGRIENEHDLKILKSYTKQYFTDEVLSHRWKPFGLSVSLPTSPRFQEYLNAIKLFPNKDASSFFGLPENIDRAWEKQTSTNIITQLKRLYVSENKSTRLDKEIFAKGLPPFFALWKKLNQGHDFIRMPIPVFRKNFETCMEIFITEEFSNGVKLIQTIHKYFTSLNKIAKGLLEAKERDVSVGHALLKYETPKFWMDIWKGPNDPNQYLRAILAKLIRLQNWVPANMDQILQDPISLSDFFHPAAFLASNKQDVSRALNTSADQLILESSWTRVANTSLILSDISMEGGVFESGSLKPSSSNSENINPAPHCYLTWIRKEVVGKNRHSSIALPKRNQVRNHFTRNQNDIDLLRVTSNIEPKTLVYVYGGSLGFSSGVKANAVSVPSVLQSSPDAKIMYVPLYKTSQREEKLTTLQVPCDENEKDKWIQNGLAFYLEI